MSRLPTPMTRTLKSTAMRSHMETSALTTPIRPVSAPVNVGGFILWNLARTCSISPILSSHIFHLNLCLSSSKTQRYTLLLNILIAARGSRLPNYLPNCSTPTSPRRHLPKLRGTTIQPPITVQWYSGATTQSATTIKDIVGPFKSDNSAGRSQRLINSISLRLSTNSPLNPSASPAHDETQQELLESPNSKALKEWKNYLLEFSTVLEHCNPFALPQHIDSTLQTVNATVKVNYSGLSTQPALTPNLIPLATPDLTITKRRHVGVPLAKIQICLSSNDVAPGSSFISSNLMLAKRRRITHTQPTPNLVYAKRHRITYTQNRAYPSNPKRHRFTSLSGQLAQHTRDIFGHPNHTQI
ncbi:auxin response factor 13 [Dorcoceras hygrometricum]|uniref:Auxin response factor 13 n=1 Tax=Dorcoceras hygrometricum TaxID=472368 RepID=A0A2Z7C532_9LAMI|nr:auxin response factor 13 [Dorcoceras hygrometricum]